MFTIMNEPIIVIDDKENPDQWYEIYAFYSPKNDLYYIYFATYITVLESYCKLYTIPEDEIIKFLKLIIICYKHFQKMVNENFIDLFMILNSSAKPYTLIELKFNFKEERLYKD